MFKTAVLKSDFCDFSDAPIFFKGTTFVGNTVVEAAATNNRTKKNWK